MACGQRVNITALGDEFVYGFIQPPNVRGTTQIVYSCLLTITACIYTSVHLNIPPPGEAAKWQMLRRIKWTLIGILAPEVVLFSAWMQYRRANRLITKMCKVAPDLVYTNPPWHQRLRTSLFSGMGREQQSRFHASDNPLEASKSTSLPSVVIRVSDDVDTAEIENSSDPAIELLSRNEVPDASAKFIPKKRRAIDLTYGFYLVMGGVRVDTSSIHHNITSMVPSFEMLMAMLDAENGQYDGAYLVSQLLVNPSTIHDRSKADGVAKALICCQVLGMAVQCIGRAFSSLPLTLLEVHTFAHILCAILLYAVWFKKPLNVNEATIVSLPDLYTTYFAGQVSVFQPRTWYLRLRQYCTCDQARHFYKLHEDKLCAHVYYRAGLSNQWPYVISTDDIGEADKANKNIEFIKENEYIEARKNMPARFQSQIVQAVTAAKGLVKIQPEHEATCRHRGEQIVFYLPLDDRDRKRWTLWTRGDLAPHATLRQSNYFQPYRELQLYRELRETDRGSEWHDRLDRRVGLEDLVDSSGYRHFTGMLEDDRSGGVGALLVLSLYAAVHLTIWNEHFPSVLETWLWRSSGLLILAFAPLCSIAIGLMLLTPTRGEEASAPIIIRDIPPVILGSWMLLMLMIVLLLCVGAIFARLFFVIEPFVALRAVPAGVYQTISWSQYLPHL